MLFIIFSMRSWSKKAMSSDTCDLKLRSNCFLFAKTWNEDTIFSQKSTISPNTAFTFIFFDSAFLKSINWLTNLYKCFAFLSIINNDSLVFRSVVLISSKFCSGPKIKVNGVLNSWEILVKNSNFILFISLSFLFSNFSILSLLL